MSTCFLDYKVCELLGRAIELIAKILQTPSTINDTGVYSHRCESESPIKLHGIIEIKAVGHGPQVLLEERREVGKYRN